MIPNNDTSTRESATALADVVIDAPFDRLASMLKLHYRNLPPKNSLLGVVE